MDITPPLRDLIANTYCLLPEGLPRRHFIADTVTKLELGQRQACGLLGYCQ